MSGQARAYVPRDGVALDGMDVDQRGAVTGPVAAVGPGVDGGRNDGAAQTVAPPIGRRGEIRIGDVAGARNGRDIAAVLLELDILRR